MYKISVQQTSLQNLDDRFNIVAYKHKATRVEKERSEKFTAPLRSMYFTSLTNVNAFADDVKMSFRHVKVGKPKIIEVDEWAHD